jgi:hypothetical protein
VFDMTWRPQGDRAELGRELMQAYRIRDARELTQCSTCHR